MLRGDFDRSFTAADNSRVVPTDTMKNTVNVLAQKELGEEIERFGIALCRHFLESYEQISECQVTLLQKSWLRIDDHAHAFTGNEMSHPWAQVVAAREDLEVRAGIRDLLILKSTGSGFAGYPKCEFTTLPETEDRIFSTVVTATWDYSSFPESFTSARLSAVDAMLRVFAENYSPSVQVSLFRMGEAALDAVQQISRIHLEFPNKHYLPVNFVPFGRENHNEIFTPTDEPHGQIEATVER
jgi:urate oxidase